MVTYEFHYILLYKSTSYFKKKCYKLYIQYLQELIVLSA